MNMKLKTPDNICGFIKWSNINTGVEEECTQGSNLEQAIRPLHIGEQAPWH